MIFQIGSFGRIVLQRVIRSEWRSGCVEYQSSCLLPFWVIGSIDPGFRLVLALVVASELSDCWCASRFRFSLWLVVYDRGFWQTLADFQRQWVQTSDSDQFVTVVRRAVWDVSAEFRGSELVAVVGCWLWRLPGVGSAPSVSSRSG